MGSPSWDLLRGILFLGIVPGILLPCLVNATLKRSFNITLHFWDLLYGISKGLPFSFNFQRSPLRDLLPCLVYATLKRSVFWDLLYRISEGLPFCGCFHGSLQDPPSTEALSSQDPIRDLRRQDRTDIKIPQRRSVRRTKLNQPTPTPTPLHPPPPGHFKLNPRHPRGNVAPPTSSAKQKTKRRRTKQTNN